MKFIQGKLLAAQSRQKEYADRKVRDLEFMEGETSLVEGFTNERGDAVW